MGRTLKQLGWKRFLGVVLAMSAAGFIVGSGAAIAADAPQRAQMDGGTAPTTPTTAPDEYESYPSIDAGTNDVSDAGMPEMGMLRRGPLRSKNVPES